MIVPTAGLFLLLSQLSAFDNNQNSCLDGNFYGNYRDGDVFRSVRIVDETCFNSISWSEESSMSIVGINEGTERLVWVEEEAVDDSLKSSSSEDEFRLLMDRLAAHSSSNSDSSDQVILSNDYTAPEATVLFKSKTNKAALLSVNPRIALTMDTILPRFWRSTPLPTSPVDFIPVPSPAVDRVVDILSHLKFNPTVARLVNGLSIPQMRNDIRFLSGEDGQSGIVSRHSFSEGSRVAARWLKTRFEETGAKCHLKPFLEGFAPNVICRYEGTENTTETVLLSAHYDSRGTFGSTRAPGGDDDGSGTTGLLAIARTIGNHGVKFRKNVELVAFAGEEQGLLGSRAYSRELRALNANLTLMIQADMLAYHHPDEPAQLGLPDLIGSPEVAQLVANVSSLYSPELVVGFTPACCSDHQPFHEQGFPSTQVFERAGPIIDPMYHNSGDLSDRVGYDFGQLKSIAKVQFATLLHTAGFDV